MFERGKKRKRDTLTEKKERERSREEGYMLRQGKDSYLIKKV